MTTSRLTFRGARPGAPWRSWLERLGDGIAQLCLWLGAAALLVIVGINGFNVVGRYIFGSALEWAEEAMQYLMVFIVFAGGTVISWRGMHMRIEALMDRVSPPLRRAAVYGSAVGGIALLLIIANASFEIVSMLYGFDQRSDALHLPMWIPQSCVTGGFILFAVTMLLRLLVFGASLPPAVSENVAEVIR